MKNYLILGANSEVGMAYIYKLNNTEPGVTAIACYRNMSEQFQEMMDVCRNISIVPIQVDLAKAEQVDKLIEELKDNCPTHILHLAAAPFEYMKIKQWDAEKAKSEMNIVYFSFAKICSVCLPAMAKNKYGKVVAMLTAYTLGTPPKFMSDYVASKYALLGFIKSAAIEYADKNLNINAVSPNMMETKFLAVIDERIVQMTADNSAKKRNVTVEETVSAIEYLMSDAASYINGVNMNISGGDYM